MSKSTSMTSWKATSSALTQSFLIPCGPGSGFKRVLAIAYSEAILFATLLNCAGYTTVA